MSTPYETLYRRFIEEIRIQNQNRGEAYSYIETFLKFMRDTMKFPQSNLKIHKYIPPHKRDDEFKDFDSDKPSPTAFGEGEMQQNEQGDWTIILALQLGDQAAFQPYIRVYLRPRIKINGNTVTLFSDEGVEGIVIRSPEERDNGIRQFHSQLQHKLESSITLLKKPRGEEKRQIGFHMGKE